MARAYRRDRGSGQAVPRLGASRAAPRTEPRRASGRRRGLHFHDRERFL